LNFQTPKSTVGMLYSLTNSFVPYLLCTLDVFGKFFSAFNCVSYWFSSDSTEHEIQTKLYRLPQSILSYKTLANFIKYALFFSNIYQQDASVNNPRSYQMPLQLNIAGSV